MHFWLVRSSASCGQSHHYLYFLVPAATIISSSSHLFLCLFGAYKQSKQKPYKKQKQHEANDALKKETLHKLQITSQNKKATIPSLRSC
jgi:hypothetical protein